MQLLNVELGENFFETLNVDIQLPSNDKSFFLIILKRLII